MSEATTILYVTPFRRRARRVEREVQAWLDEGREYVRQDHLTIDAAAFPSWARGVRVERAGRLSWAVVATAERGH